MDIFNHFSPTFLAGKFCQVGKYWGSENIVCNFCKLYYFVDGEAKITIYGKDFYPQNGELMLIPPFIEHSFTYNPEKPVIKYWCHFDFGTGLNRSLLFNKDCLLCRPNKDEIVPVFESLLSLVEQKTPSSLLKVKANILELLAIFFENIDITKVKVKSETGVYELIKNYIEENLDKNLTITELAEVSNLQPNYFIRIFKEYFKETPISYINHLRLEKSAKMLIEEVGVTIEQVAIANGFQDYRYFSRLFTKRFGIPPLKYMKLNNPNLKKK